MSGFHWWEYDEVWKIKPQTSVERLLCKKYIKKSEDLQWRKTTGDYWKMSEEI